jgi:hypothetical protein
MDNQAWAGVSRQSVGHITFFYGYKFLMFGSLRLKGVRPKASSTSYRAHSDQSIMIRYQVVGFSLKSTFSQCVGIEWNTIIMGFKWKIADSDLLFSAICNDLILNIFLKVSHR